MLQSLSRDVLSLLQQGGRSLAGEGGRARRALAGIEIALAVLLLVTATLVTRTFLNLRAVNVGFNADRVLAFDVPQPTSRYPDARASQDFADRLLPRLATLPESNARRPCCCGRSGVWPAWIGPSPIEGQSPTDARQNPLVNLEAVSRHISRRWRFRSSKDGHPRRGPRRPRRCSGGQREFRTAVLARRPGARTPSAVPAPRITLRPSVVHRSRHRRRREVPGAARQPPRSLHQLGAVPVSGAPVRVRTTGRPDSVVNAIRAEVRAIDSGAAD